MKKLLHILNSGWFFLLATAVLIAGGRFGGAWLRWTGATLVVLCIAAGTADCVRRIRAGRYLRRKTGEPENPEIEK